MTDDKPKPYTLEEQEQDFRLYGYGTRDRHRATVEALDAERAARVKTKDELRALGVKYERAVEHGTDEESQKWSAIARAEKAEKERDENTEAMFKAIANATTANARAEELAKRLAESEAKCAMHEGLRKESRTAMVNTATALQTAMETNERLQRESNERELLRAKLDASERGAAALREALHDIGECRPAALATVVVWVCGRCGARTSR